MIPLFYQNCLKSQLKKTEYLTLVMVVCLLQMHKQVSIERLATVWPYPILFESRRKSLQRFLFLPALRIETLWFPVIEFILKTAFSPQQVLILAIDRTQWRQNNLFFISLIWERRAIPLYWIILPKKGSSNLQEQQSLIAPVLSLLKDYQIILLGDREFGSVKLAQWLCDSRVKFVLRVKQERYIQFEKSEYQHLSDLGLMPGTSFYLRGVKVTKQKGFGKFDVAGYWRRKYKINSASEGWYLLTHVGSLKLALASFKCRSGIEAMFKDCKTGGYNLENSQACHARLNSLVMLVALAYTCAIIRGITIKQMGIQKYVGRVQELGRAVRRHSSFWIGLYGECWVTGIEVCLDLVSELMKIRTNKRPFFQKGIRAITLILSTL
jgi:Transposase DDE domain.